MSEKIHPFLKSNDSGISLENLIALYEWLYKAGRLKKGSVISTSIISDGYGDVRYIGKIWITCSDGSSAWVVC